MGVVARRSDRHLQPRWLGPERRGHHRPDRRRACGLRAELPAQRGAQAADRDLRGADR